MHAIVPYKQNEPIDEDIPAIRNPVHRLRRLHHLRHRLHQSLHQVHLQLCLKRLHQAKTWIHPHNPARCTRDCIWRSALLLLYFLFRSDHRSDCVAHRLSSPCTSTPTSASTLNPLAHHQPRGMAECAAHKGCLHASQPAALSCVVPIAGPSSMSSLGTSLTMSPCTPSSMSWRVQRRRRSDQPTRTRLRQARPEDAPTTDRASS